MKYNVVQAIAISFLNQKYSMRKKIYLSQHECGCSWDGESTNVMTSRKKKTLPKMSARQRSTDLSVIPICSLLWNKFGKKITININAITQSQRRVSLLCCQRWSINLNNLHTVEHTRQL